MDFNEINDANKAAALAAAGKAGEKRGRKRKNSICNDDSSTSSSKVGKAHKKVLADPKDGDLRTGRWSAEEMAYCDKLIYCFKEGILPVEDGTKLNDFLASLLKSKQSRLTKKMKVSVTFSVRADHFSVRTTRAEFLLFLSNHSTILID